MEWYRGLTPRAHQGSPDPLEQGSSTASAQTWGGSGPNCWQLLQMAQFSGPLSPPLLLSSEKAMAPHSSTLAWEIPWTEEPSRLQSTGSLRVDRTELLHFHFLRWRRKWQPTPVFLPGEPQERGSLVGCRLWGSTESDTTEVT